MKKLVLILLLFLSANIYAQYFSMGTDPANIKWRQIKTPVVKLVFDKQMEEEALKLAAFFDSIAPHVSASLNYQPKRVNVLLHNHTAMANGFVSWAPRRSEFFTIPSQDNNSNLWLEHLAIHEYRHVVQMSKLNRGLVKVAGYFTGQQAVGAVGGLFLPMWFLEGDAVMTETALTNSGRGRSFDFINPVKAQIIDKQIYSFEKSYLGSFKDHLPNYYQMGYLFAAVNREKHGTELWENAVLNVGRRPLKLHPFYRKTREITGQKKKPLFKNSFEYLKDEWIDEIKNQKFTEYENIIDDKEKNYYIDYQYLNFFNDSLLLAEASGPATRRNLSFININTGQKEVIKYLGPRNHEPISINDRHIAWSEIRNDVRWELKATSTIYTYNITTGKTKKLTKKGHFFSPTLHPTENILAAVESTISNEYFITIIDSYSGKIIKQIKTPQNFYPITPAWNEATDEIVVILLSKDGKAFYSLNKNSEEWTKLTNHNFDEKREPIINNNKIFYTAKGAISDEIFELNLKNGKIKQLTSSKYGARYPTVKNGKLAYSHLTADGWKPSIYTETEEYFEERKEPALVDRLVNSITEQEEALTIDENHQKTDYKVKRYSRFNLFNFHSWAPLYYDVDKFEMYAGATLLSQNLLNNTIFTAGYNANPAKKTERYKLNLKYTGLYPIFDINFSYGNEPFKMVGIYYVSENQLIDANINSKIDHYKLQAGVKLPFTFQKNNYQRYLQLSSKYVLEHRRQHNFTVKEVIQVDNKLIYTNQFSTISTTPINFNVFEYSFYFSNNRIGTIRDVDQRFRQILTATYRHNPTGTHKNGSIYGISTRLNFPGFGKHDVFSVGADYQHKNNGEISMQISNMLFFYRASQLVNYPRGYNSIMADNLYILRVNYHHLVWNPEFAIGPIIYIKRITNQLFTDQLQYDYTYHFTDKPSLKYRERAGSYGTEIMADVHLIQSTIKFKFGTRIGIRDEDKKMFGDFLFSFNI